MDFLSPEPWNFVFDTDGVWKELLIIVSVRQQNSEVSGSHQACQACK